MGTAYLKDFNRIVAVLGVLTGARGHGRLSLRPADAATNDVDRRTDATGAAHRRGARRLERLGKRAGS